LIATPKEQCMYGLHTLKRRDLFVLKEAVYKAFFHWITSFVSSKTWKLISLRDQGTCKANRTFALELLISKNVIGLAYSRPNDVEGADHPINLRG